MTVGTMLDQMSSRELSEWMAYANIEPLGDDRADLQASIVASTVANANRDPKRKPSPFTPADFLIDYWKAEDAEPDQLDRPDPDLLRAKFDALTVAV